MLHLALWKDGQLKYNKYKNLYIRINNKKVILKCIYNSQNIIDEFLNEVKSYYLNKYNIKIYGISQNPNTKDYIMVLQEVYCKRCGEILYISYSSEPKNKLCKLCQINDLKENFVNWTSGNEKIDNFIHQEMQLKMGWVSRKIFEWIPYNQFNDIKQISKDEFGTLHLATWKDNVEVSLKHLYNSQNNTDEFLNKVESYSNKCGISQNPDTNDYIIVSVNRFCQNCGNQYTNPEYGWCKLCQINDLKEFFENWTSGNEKIDNYTQEMQLQIDNYNDTVVEWVPYHQFEYIKEIRKDGFGTLHLAIWKDGPLEFDDAIFIKGYIRTNNKRVILKCIYNSQNITNEILSEAKSYSIKYSDNLPSIYGISQNPSTNDYILVLQDGYCEKCAEIYTDIKEKWCKPCQINNLKENFVNWTSENEKIDNFIQEMQLKINGINNIVVEWIPYNQFDNIEEIGTGGFATVYSAKWEDNILHYNASEKKYERYKNLNRTVALKCLYDSQNITNEFLNEV
uniref:Protein kinase domain-containing protein n=1 Tax=Rhizophagus irregularis (strain DAOM 181602 / DAOM 197198 / MUCL 43194) TaxID=747089 RepID=U9TKT8_RHIID